MLLPCISVQHDQLVSYGALANTVALHRTPALRLTPWRSSEQDGAPATWTVHLELYRVHLELYRVHLELHRVHLNCIVYILNCIVYILNCTMYLELYRVP